MNFIIIILWLNSKHIFNTPFRRQTRYFRCRAQQNFQWIAKVNKWVKRFERNQWFRSNTKLKYPTGLAVHAEINESVGLKRQDILACLVNFFSTERISYAIYVGQKENPIQYQWARCSGPSCSWSQEKDTKDKERKEFIQATGSVASLFISLDSIISAFFFKLPTLVFLNSNYP